MAASSAAASKLLNIRNSALHNLIRRHLLHHSAAAVATSKNLIPSTSNQSLNLFLLKIGGVKYLWPLSSSLMRIEGARNYATKGSEDPDSVEDNNDDDDDDDDDDYDYDDMVNYSGSEFDDEVECENTDEDPDIM